jgi:hypothetical protein
VSNPKTQNKKIKTMVTERHHVIPISIQGWDTQENMIVVSKQDHALIHKTLNIPYQFIREFREKTNHKLHLDKDFFVELRALHCRYFEYIYSLPNHLLNQHVHSLELQIERLEQDYSLCRKENALADSNLFGTRLYQYHDLLLKASKNGITKKHGDSADMGITGY